MSGGLPEAWSVVQAAEQHIAEVEYEGAQRLPAKASVAGVVLYLGKPEFPVPVPGVPLSAVAPVPALETRMVDVKPPVSSTLGLCLVAAGVARLAHNAYRMRKESRRIRTSSPQAEGPSAEGLL